MSGRNFGALPVKRWRDANWAKLTVEAQWLYMMLASHASTNSAGVFPMQIGKWSKAAANLDADKIQAAGRTLTAHGFIAVDGDTEEGLLIPYMQDDQAKGNVFIGVLKEAGNTESEALRRKLFLNIQELFDDKTQQPRIFDAREQKLIEKLAATLEETAGDLRARETGPLPSLSPSPAPHDFEDTSDTLRTDFEDSSKSVRDGECLKCRQAQNLGPEAKPGENPMWCGDCNYLAAAARRRAQQEQEWR